MAASAKRIDGIDFWRGVALLMIFIDHVPENVFQRVTQQNFGFSDAAELFVFLSGVSVALAYGTRFFDGETVGAVRAVLRRAFTIYWVQILISLLIIAMFVGAAALWNDTDLLDAADDRRHFGAPPSARERQHPAALYRAVADDAVAAGAGAPRRSADARGLGRDLSGGARVLSQFANLARCGNLVLQPHRVAAHLRRRHFRRTPIKARRYRLRRAALRRLPRYRRDRRGRAHRCPRLCVGAVAARARRARLRQERSRMRAARAFPRACLRRLPFRAHRTDAADPRIPPAVPDGPLRFAGFCDRHCAQRHDRARGDARRSFQPPVGVRGRDRGRRHLYALSRRSRPRRVERQIRSPAKHDEPGARLANG